MALPDFEKLGSFYLGKRHDAAADTLTDELVLYDSKDLTTHAVIIGMTGSGKTGLGIGVLEEAALDHIPVIAIDPKGDMGNLLLTFPKLAAKDFQPQFLNAGKQLTSPNKGELSRLNGAVDFCMERVEALPFLSNRLGLTLPVLGSGTKSVDLRFVVATIRFQLIGGNDRIREDFIERRQPLIQLLVAVADPGHGLFYRLQPVGEPSCPFNFLGQKHRQLNRNGGCRRCCFRFTIGGGLSGCLCGAFSLDLRRLGGNGSRLLRHSCSTS